MTAPRVLYLAGWGRSGSTLLNSLLARKGVVAVGELRWLWRRGVIGGYMCSCRQPWHDCELWRPVVQAVLTMADFREGARSADDAVTRAARKALVWSALRRRLPVKDGALMARRLYERIAEGAGAAVVVDSSKSPEHAALARATGLDVKIVHLVRDARGVTWSNQRSKELPSGVTLPPFRERRHPAYVAARWTVRNLLIDIAVRPDLRLRYEDLATNPEASIASIFDTIGLELPPPGGVEHTISGNSTRFTPVPAELRPDVEWIERQPSYHRLVTTVLSAPLLARYGYPLRLAMSPRYEGAKSQ